MRANVIDTNVTIVANNKAEQATPDCVRRAVNALKNVRSGRISIDDGTAILDEYRTYLSHSGQPGPGDAFFKWLWDRRYKPTKCERVKITFCSGPLGGENYEEFPAHNAFTSFDPNDRKFVAVACASRFDTHILQAVDTKWWHYKDAFLECGVSVNFLCPELMETGAD